MKKLILSLVLVSLMVCFGYATADDSLVLYLSFNEGKGNEVKDGSIYGNHGEIVDENNVEWAEGRYGNCVQITAETADPVVIPNSDSLMIEGAISMMAWAKPEAWSSGESTHLLDKGCHTAQTMFSYGFEVRQGHMLLFFLGTGENRAHCWVETSLELGGWQHFAGTYDDDEGGKFYLNGVLVGESPMDSDGKFQGTNDIEVRIGGAKERAQYGWVGLIDEFYLFDRAISEAEINAAMNDKFLSVSPKGRLTTTWASIKAD